MAEAKRDQNHIPTILGVSDADGLTPVNITVNPANHALTINDGVAGSSSGIENAARDANRKPVLIAVSAVDGVTPVPIYADELTGGLYVNSH
jgi:hypothetical protein